MTNKARSPAELHRDALVIDSHNDTIVMHIRRGNRSVAGTASGVRHRGTVATLCDPLDLAARGPGVQIDVPKMRSGGIDAGFFAVDVTLARQNQLAYALDAFGFFTMECADSGVDIVRSAGDVRKARDAGRPSAILAIENSDALEGSLNILRMFHEIGVRSIGLTHNPRSLAADGNGESRSGGGLTRFGVALVQEMNRLGVLVDVSHISERGFWDVIEITDRPIIASHSNCATLCDHPRNLTDEQIRALARNGGTMGVTFVPSFVDASNPTFERLLDHITHAVEVAGAAHVGIGSDFDGGGTLIEDATAYPAITEGLVRRGFGEQEIRGILGENHLRVLSSALKPDSDGSEARDEQQNADDDDRG